MKFIEKIYNPDNLIGDDIAETTTRARGIIINLLVGVLLCYSNGLAILYHDYNKNKNIIVINENNKVLYYINEWESLIPYEKENLFFDLSMINEQSEFLQQKH